MSKYYRNIDDHGKSKQDFKHVGKYTEGDKNPSAFLSHLYICPNRKSDYCINDMDEVKRDNLQRVVYASYGYSLVRATSHAQQVSDLEVKFNQLAEKWKDETGLYSTVYQKIINDLYFEIVGLGKEIIPFILSDLRKNGPAQWHTALKALTNENPVPEEDLKNNRNKKIKEAWVKWGIENNLI